MNYFEVIPVELVKKILFFVPDIYYYFSINVLNRFWNETIILYLKKDLIWMKYDEMDVDKIFDDYSISGDWFKRIEFFMLESIHL